MMVFVVLLMMIILAAFLIESIQEDQRVISNKFIEKRQKAGGDWQNSVDYPIAPALATN